MKSYFFNAEPTSDLAAHPTGYDREYDADDHAEFFAPFFSEAGVMAGVDADACKVVAESNNILRVGAGCAYVRGRMCRFEGNETIVVTENCKLVARMNKTADVRAFQLVTVPSGTALTRTEDIYDLELASVEVTAIMGGYTAVVTDTRTFLAFVGQPPYYPPTADNLPYILWLYTMGYPMTQEQKAAVEGNPSLMAIFHGSIGASRAVTVDFVAGDWGAPSEEIYTMTIPRSRHGRQSARFGYMLAALVGGVLTTGVWATMCTGVSYQEDGSIRLTSGDAYAGAVTFFAT